MPLHQTSGRWQLGLALALVTIILWGSLPLVLGILLQGLDAFTIVWFRFLTAFTCLTLYLAQHQAFPPLGKLSPNTWRLLAIAAVGLPSNYILFMLGLVQTSPTNAQIVTQLAPILLGLMALVLFRERYSFWQWLGLGIFAVGFGLFFQAQLQVLLTSVTQYWQGNLLLVLASLMWAIYGLAQKQLLQSIASPVAMAGIYGGAALILTPLAAPMRLLQLTPVQWGLLIFCAFNTLLAYGAFAEALNHWEASRVSAVLSLTPLVTIAMVFVLSRITPQIVVADSWTVSGLLGALLVITGSLTIALGRPPSTDGVVD